MLSNISAPFRESTVDYPIADSSLPFSAYIERCKEIIEERRQDLHPGSSLPTSQLKIILEANSPYELIPSQPVMNNGRLKYGVLLIHELLDSPFSLRDIGTRLQRDGMLCRSVLLPGHGTQPSDLLDVTYHDWIQAVRYGVDSLRKEVEEIYLVGYSTGAALSIYQALQDTHIRGIILLAPAIQIKAPVDIVVGWHYLTRKLSNQRQWLYSTKEVDYAKYSSIAFNPITQVSKLTKVIKEMRQHHPLTCPVFMAVSREDETISSDGAITFFSHLHNPDNRLLLYTAHEHIYPDSRIISRLATYPDHAINHFSHVSIPFAPNNPHYGPHGDYCYASIPHGEQYIYGAYNHIEVDVYNFLCKLKLLKCKRRELTYNPDFDFMSEKISNFISS